MHYHLFNIHLSTLAGLYHVPVERTGRFWTLMPKLLRGSSLSREDNGRADGAGTAADCTERAGESSLELLLDSLQQSKHIKYKDLMHSAAFLDKSLCCVIWLLTSGSRIVKRTACK